MPPILYHMTTSSHLSYVIGFILILQVGFEHLDTFEDTFEVGNNMLRSNFFLQWPMLETFYLLECFSRIYYTSPYTVERTFKKKLCFTYTGKTSQQDIKLSEGLAVVIRSCVWSDTCPSIIVDKMLHGVFTAIFYFFSFCVCSLFISYGESLPWLCFIFIKTMLGTYSQVQTPDYIALSLWYSIVVQFL